VKVFWHSGQRPRRIPIQSCCLSCACLRRRPWPTIDGCWQTGHHRGNCARLISVTPGSLLSSADGSAIKRITAGVRACRWSPCQVRSGAGLHPPVQTSVERKKNNGIYGIAPALSIPNIGRYLATRQEPWRTRVELTSCRIPPKHCERSNLWRYGTLPGTLRNLNQATRQLFAWLDRQFPS
jgi:hypothetical protein